MILLDTHVVVWLVGDEPPFGKDAIRAIASDDDRRVPLWFCGN